MTNHLHSLLKNEPARLIRCCQIAYSLLFLSPFLSVDSLAQVAWWTREGADKHIVIQFSLERIAGQASLHDRLVSSPLDCSGG